MKRIHKETRKNTEYSRNNGIIKWKIKKDGYELNDNGNMSNFDLLNADIEEDDGVDEYGPGNSIKLSCNGIVVDFCPRGYYVNSLYCPTVEIAFSVYRNGDEILTYDEFVM